MMRAMPDVISSFLLISRNVFRIFARADRKDVQSVFGMPGKE